MADTTLRRHRQLLVIAAIVSAICAAVGPLSLVLLPLDYLNTHLHELSHALAGIVTGGSVGSIHVFSDGSGVTSISGGSTLVSASAGYLGATLAGCLVIVASATQKGARLALLVLGGAIAASMVLFVRGDLVGFGAGALWTGLLLLAATKLKGEALLFTAQFIGIQQCIHSFGSLRDLWSLSLHPGVETDARILERVSLLPAPVWAVTWVVISLIMMTWAVRASWNAMTRRGRNQPQ